MTAEQLLQSIIEDYDQLPKGDSPSQDLEQATERATIVLSDNYEVIYVNNKSV